MSTAVHVPATPALCKAEAKESRGLGGCHLAPGSVTDSFSREKDKVIEKDAHVLFTYAQACVHFMHIHTAILYPDTYIQTNITKLSL